VICFLQEGKDMQFDLFDQEEAHAAGERQMDLEEILDAKAEIAFEDSLLGKIQSGDQEGVKNLIAQAEAGQVIRIM
jgi:hypothetical protein